MANLDRPVCEAISRAGAGDAQAVELEERAMTGAEDSSPVPGQIAVVHHRQRPAGVGAGIDEAAHRLALAHQEAGEQRVLGPEPEALRAGVGEVGQGAEARAGGGTGRDQSWPTVTLN